MIGSAALPLQPVTTSGSWLLLLGLGLAFLTPTTATGQQKGASHGETGAEVLWHESTALFPMRVHLPPGFDTAEQYPAVVALHGFGGSADRFDRIGRAFAQAGFITVVPEGPYRVRSEEPGFHSNWELTRGTEELGLGPPMTEDHAVEARSIELTIEEFFPNVIDRVRDEYRVGPVYLFGFSMGGVYALVGGFLNRDRVDGIVAFGAQFYRQLFTVRGDRLEDGNRLKIRLGLGRSDPLVPFTHGERARAAFEEAGYEVVLDAFPGGHSVPDDALARAVMWLEEVASRD
jgi:predicted esterase